jgi:hypothetical protein
MDWLHFTEALILLVLFMAIAIAIAFLD